MVDEYEAQKVLDEHVSRVQIPLWSMNTNGAVIEDSGYIAFRFLYGR